MLTCQQVLHACRVSKQHSTQQGMRRARRPMHQCRMKKTAVTSCLLLPEAQLLTRTGAPSGATELSVLHYNKSRTWWTSSRLSASSGMPFGSRTPALYSCPFCQLCSTSSLMHDARPQHNAGAFGLVIHDYSPCHLTGCIPFV